MKASVVIQNLPLRCKTHTPESVSRLTDHGPRWNITTEEL